mgnify:CR=1 FL=1
MEVIMKKYWWVIVLLGLLVVAGGLIYFVTTDFEEEIQLLEEMEEVYALMDEHNTDELNQKLDTIISTGDYAVVEKAAKNYTRDLYNVVTNISNELANDRIMRLTTYENFQNDGPEFTESKAYIIETKEKLENYKTAYQELYTEEKADSYLETNLDSYYIDFYHQIIGDEEEDTTTVNNIDEIIEILTNSETVIDFLIENKNSWTLENNMISFTNDELSNQYSELILKIAE